MCPGQGIRRITRIIDKPDKRLVMLGMIEPNDALSGPRGGEGAPNQQQPANRPDGSLQ